MGNEMPNRNMQPGPEEEDSMQNQSSQQSSGGVAGPIEKDMPMSTMASVQGPEHGLGSGSKEKDMTNKDGLVSEVKASTMEGDQNVQAKNSEEKREIPRDPPDESASKSIDVGVESEKGRVDHQEAVVPAQEAIRGEGKSSKNMEPLPDQTKSECNENEDGYAAPLELEVGAIHEENKVFDEGIRISHPATKQTCLEIMTNEKKTETDFSGVRDVSVNASTVPVHMNTCEPIVNKSDTGSSDATRVLTESKDDSKKDLELECNTNNQDPGEDMKAGEKVAVQNETQGPLHIGSPSTGIQKLPFTQGSGARDIHNYPVMSDQMPSEQHGLEENSTDNKTFPVNESCSNNVESTVIPNGLKSFSEAKQGIHILNLPHKTMQLQTEVNGSKESVKEQSEDFTTKNEIMQGQISNNNEKILGSDMSNGFLHDQNIEAREDNMASAVERLDNSSSMLLDENEHGKQELSITAQVADKCVKPQFELEVLQENTSSVLHEEKEHKKECKSEVGTEMIQNPNFLLSNMDPTQYDKGKTEKELVVTEVIHKSDSLPSTAEYVANSAIILVEQVKITLNEKVSTVVEEAQKPASKQSTDLLRNEHDKSEEMSLADEAYEEHRSGEVGPADEEYEDHRSGDVGPADEALKELPHSKAMDLTNRSLLLETEDKPSNTLATEVCEETQNLGFESSVSLYKIEDKEQDSNIQNKEIDTATLTLGMKDQNLQGQIEGHAQEVLDVMSGKYERITMEPEVKKLQACEESTSSLEFASKHTEKKSDKIFQNSCLNIMDASQKQENINGAWLYGMEQQDAYKQKDINGSAIHEMQKQDANGVSTNIKPVENGILPMSDKEFPKLLETHVSTTETKLDDGKTKYTPCSEDELHTSDSLSYPKLESWHQESEDDLKTPLLLTAEGSPESKESGSQSNVDVDDPKESLERTDSEKVRTPLRHLLKEDSSVAGSERSLIPKNQQNSKQKVVEDVWGSPAKLISSPSSKDKQKSRSIFSQCMCCSAVQ